jgi:hypothetical protein
MLVKFIALIYKQIMQLFDRFLFVSQAILHIAAAFLLFTFGRPMYR